MDFQKTYNRKDYLDFFRDTLLPEDFEITDEPITPDFQPERIQRITKIGQVPSLDLPVFEAKHKSENDPRVTLSKESFRILANYGKQQALILFISTAAANFRLSLITLDLKLEGKRVKKEYSNPRRYSFFLGPQCKAHTPQQVLNDRVKDLEDLNKRFSIEVVNKEFYTEIALRFTELAGGTRKIGSRTIDEGKGLLKLPDTKDETIRKEFAVRLIGRLIFGWFLKKKTSKDGIPLIPEEILSLQAMDSPKGVGGYYHSTLEPLFFEVLNTPVSERKKPYKNSHWKLIPFLNGGLFTPHDHDFYILDDSGYSRHINDLKVPDLWLVELLKIFETYNFTIDENTPVDIELSIEPEMLGRIFENLLAEINPETGETARKATGSYYTPRPIVEYMVDESLKQYLLTKTGLKEEIIASLLSYSDNEDFLISDQHKESVIQALHDVRIIDPACGSGAFPMGNLQKILLVLQKLDPDSKIWLEKLLSVIPDPMYRKELKKKIKVPNYLHKLGIIRDCIFGVDIQPIAVEISKLRCFLSLIVDEKVDDNDENRGIEHLPNLEFKFVCANTLIGLPKNVSGKTIKSQSKFGPKEYKDQSLMFEATDKIDELKKLRDEYLVSYGKDKKKIEDRFRKVQSDMFQHDLDMGGRTAQTAKLSQWNPFSDEACSWFDPDWMFGIKEGFDIVIANPPYIRQEDIRDFKPILNKAGYEIFNSTSDLYTYFYELSYNLLQSDGFSCFITSNKWMRAKYGKKLRIFFKTKTKVKYLIDFQEQHQFKAAITNTNILIFQKSLPPEDHVLSYVNIKSDYKSENLYSYWKARSQTLIQKELTDSSWTLAGEKVLKIKKIIEQEGTPLKEWKLPFYRGVVTGFNEAFIIDSNVKEFLCREDPKSAEFIKPILRGRDIRRYKYTWSNFWIIFIPWHFPLHSDTSIHGASQKAEKEFKRLYPAIYNYLLQYKEQLSQRNKDETDVRYEWYALQRCAATYYQEFEKDKIVWIRLSNDNRFSYDSEKHYVLDSTFFITCQDNKFLLAILNSKLCKYYFDLICHSSGMATNQWNEDGVSKIPVKKLPKTKQYPFEIIVEYILCLNKLNDDDNNTQISFFNQLIDGMVFELYFEKELKEAGRDVLIHLKDLKQINDDMSENKKMDVIESEYKRLNSNDSPVRNNLFYMTTIPEIRTILGLDENED